MDLFRLAFRFVSHSSLSIFLLSHAVPPTFGARPFLAVFQVPQLELADAG